MRERVTLGDLVKAHLQVEGYFFRHAAGMTLGALPFALASLGPPGIALTVAWSLIYLVLTLPGWLIFPMAIADVVNLLRGRAPTFFPLAQGVSRADVDDAIAQMPPLQRIWMRLTLSYGFYMHPLTIPTMFLSGYIEDRSAIRNGQPPIASPPRDPYLAKLRRRERQIEDIEAGAMAGAT